MIPREDQAIAALLHDAAEDQGGRETLESFRRRFGDRVAGIVVCADKLYDARAILQDCRRLGDRVFERFRADKEATLWYYCSVAEALARSGLESWLVDELARTVSELEAVASGPPDDSIVSRQQPSPEPGRRGLQHPCGRRGLVVIATGDIPDADSVLCKEMGIGSTPVAGQVVPVSGRIIPIMGTMKPTRTQLADALFTPVQQRVLALLFGQPDRQFQSAELIRLVASGTGAVHRQLRRLADAGLVTVTRVGNQKHYQARRDTPVFSELHGLVVKTVGIVEPLRAALASLADRIAAAFVFGSVAKRTDRASSDIDLFVISADLAYPAVYEALQPAERVLARPVNPTVMSPTRWRDKQAQHDSFVARIADQPKLFVIGSEDALP